MTYEEAEKLIEILERHNIPARMLTYGNPRTWDGFKVDSMGGKFRNVVDILERLVSKADDFTNASVEIDNLMLKGDENETKTIP